MAGEIQLNSVTLATESGGVASIDSSVNIKGPLNASGSAPIYACRAWVNFDGTFGTSPFTEANGGIRASGNVSSITDNGPGQYTVNFTTDMPDLGYCPVVSAGSSNSAYNVYATLGTTKTVSSLRVLSGSVTASANNFTNTIQFNVAIFR